MSRFHPNSYQTVATIEGSGNGEVVSILQLTRQLQ
jgi:hypothetical protein